MKRLFKRLVPYMSRVERRLSLPYLVILLVLLTAAAATATVVASGLLIVADPAAAAFRVTAALAATLTVGAFSVLAALHALSLRHQARMVYDLRAARADLRQVSTSVTSSRTSSEGAARDLLETLRVVGVEMEATAAGQTQMLTTVLEHVLAAEQESQAVNHQLSKSSEWLTNALDAARLKSFRQVQGLMALHSLLELRRPLPALGDWAVSADAAASLVEIVLDRRPRAIVELGSGVSTVLFAYALQAVGGGSVVSLEHDASYAEQTRQALRSHGLQDVATVLDAPLVSTEIGGELYRWYDLTGAALPASIDVMFIDGPPAVSGRLARYPALPLLWDRLAPDADILLDDADRADEKEMVQRWLGEHPELRLTHLPHERGTALLSRAR